MNFRLKNSSSILGSNEEEPPITPRAKALSATSWEINEEDGDDSDDEHEFKSPNVWLTAKVWKEKSGWAGTFKKKTSHLLPLGHYHNDENVGTALHDADDEGSLWVRRQIVLDGHFLMYYHAKAKILHEEFPEVEEGTTRAHDDDHESHEKLTPHTSTIPQIDASLSRPTSHPKSTMTVFQGMWYNFEETIRQHQQKLGLIKSPSAPSTPVIHVQRRETGLPHHDSILSATEAPRGVLDFHSNDISVSIAPQSHLSSSFISPTPPTPFCLVIKGNKKDVKWKFCFDCRDEMFKWLAVLSDVVVNKNVRGFNKRHGTYKYPEIVNEPLSYNPLERAVAEKLLPTLNSFNASIIERSPSVLDEELAPNRRSYQSLVSTVEDKDATIPPRPTLFRSTSIVTSTTGPVMNSTTNNTTISYPKSWVLVGSDLYKTILIINGAILYAFLVGASEGLFFVIHMIGCALLANSGLFLFLQKYNGYNSAQASQHPKMVSYLRQKGNMLFSYTNRKLFPHRYENKPVNMLSNNTTAFVAESTPLILTRGISTRDKLTSTRSISFPHDLIISQSKRSISLHSHLTIPTSNIGAQNDNSDISVSFLDHHSSKNLRENGDENIFDSSLYRLSSDFPSKPVAGSTTCQTFDAINLTPTAPTIQGRTNITWLASPSSSIEVRGPDYMTSKKKIPCSHSLYKLIAVDLFESSEFLHPITPKFKVQDDWLNNYEDNSPESPLWKAPDFFVVSIALPTSTMDTRGYTLVGYYQMKDETRTILKMISQQNYNPALADEALIKSNLSYRSLINGVKVWERWCKEAPSNTSMQSRFKFLARGDNLKEIGVMKWILNYNGKPILIKRSGQTGFLYDKLDHIVSEKKGVVRKSASIMEFHLNLHAFPFLCRQAIVLLKDYYFAKMLTTFAFTIEGRSEDELPEVLIGDGLQVHYPDPQLIRPLF